MFVSRLLTRLLTAYYSSLLTRFLTTYYSYLLPSIEFVFYYYLSFAFVIDLIDRCDILSIAIYSNTDDLLSTIYYLIEFLAIARLEPASSLSPTPPVGHRLTTKPIHHRGFTYIGHLL